jgi:hypothetical protein
MKTSFRLIKTIRRWWHRTHYIRCGYNFIQVYYIEDYEKSEIRAKFVVLTDTTSLM